MKIHFSAALLLTPIPHFDNMLPVVENEHSHHAIDDRLIFFLPIMKIPGRFLEKFSLDIGQTVFSNRLISEGGERRVEVAIGPDSVREEKLICLMERYEESLKRMCCVYLRDAVLAEDAVQETFVKAYKCLDSFRGESNEKTWLMRIAINTCKDIRRASWFRYVDRDVTLESIPAPICDRTFEQVEFVMDVMRLPRKYLEVVLLHYYQGLTTREVAQVLKISHQTISFRLRRAREKLRVTLEGG